MIPEAAVEAAVQRFCTDFHEPLVESMRAALEAAAPHLTAQAFEELAEIQAQPKASLAEQILEISRSKGGPFEGGLMLDECQWLASILIASNPHKQFPTNGAA